MAAVLAFLGMVTGVVLCELGHPGWALAAALGLLAAARALDERAQSRLASRSGSRDQGERTPYDLP